MKKDRREDEWRGIGESEEAEVTSGGPPVVLAEVSLMGESREWGLARACLGVVTGCFVRTFV